MTTILAIVGDLHVNSTVGLVTPTINLDDGGTISSSKDQKFLWKRWLVFWDEIRKVGKSNKAEVWTVFNGDMVDVNGKHQTSQLISLNDTDVFSMTLDTIQPALDISERVFVIRGTAAHVRSSASMEEKIAIDIGAEKCGDNYSWWELLLECEHVQFDIRHHGPLGRMDHTRGNALNRRATEMMRKYANRRCPEVAIQSHNHRFSTSSDEFPVKVYALPAWQLITEFVNRIGNIMPADIGGMYFICDKGAHVPVVKRYKPEAVRPWRAKAPIKGAN
jgi:hypothetical protein